MNCDHDGELGFMRKLEMMKVYFSYMNMPWWMGLMSLS